MNWSHRTAWHRRPSVLRFGVSCALFALVWTWQILADIGRLLSEPCSSFVNLRKHFCDHLSKKERTWSNTTTNSSIVRAQRQTILPTSVVSLSTFHRRSIGFDEQIISLKHKWQRARHRCGWHFGPTGLVWVAIVDPPGCWRALRNHCLVHVGVWMKKGYPKTKLEDK